MTWLVPTLGYVVVTGAVGVTTKLALRSVEWPELVVWSAIAYAVAAAVVLLAGRGSLSWGPDAPWAVASGILPALSLICLFLALDVGEVNRVVPVGSAYPVVTVLLAVAFLGESLSLSRVAGLALVVGGVVLLSRGPALA